MGGDEPAVTDANLFLGYLADGTELGGEVVLRRELSEKALAALGEKLNLAAEDVALGTVRVANAEMTRALRIISVERGLDPREFALLAFGGAGGMHACALAEELGMQTVLVPRAGGVLSALGLAISDIRRDYVSPYLFPSTKWTPKSSSAGSRRWSPQQKGTSTLLNTRAGPTSATRASPSS